MNKEERDDHAEGIKRREFLQVLSASFAALAAGGCTLRPPKEKIVPYLELPENTVPGLARYYASTCSSCTASCGTLVKVRDGRPIKMEGNPEHPLSRGGLCARGQASILDLYDSERLKGPFEGESPISWTDADTKIESELARLRSSKGTLRVVTPTLISPALRSALRAFIAHYPGAKHVTYDAISSDAIREAHNEAFGRNVLPHYSFNKARAIVSFDADFLGTWISPVEFTKDWAANRKPETEWDMMSWHAQYEARMSVTGANADLRVAIKPSEIFPAVSSLATRIAEKTGWKGRQPLHAVKKDEDRWHTEETAQMLLQEKGRSLVVSGSSDVGVQVLIAWINDMLGNYGATLHIDTPSNQQRGDFKDLLRLTEEMEKGQVDALIILGANPAYDHPQAAAFSKAMEKVGLTVSLSGRRDETAAQTRFICPDAHPMESWGDAEPVAGMFSINQPLIAPLFDSRPALETLLKWAGKPEKTYDYLRNFWKRNVFPYQKSIKSFTRFWDESVRMGIAETKVSVKAAKAFRSSAFDTVRPRRAPIVREFEMVAYPSISLADGKHANNPWLQELPDPISKVTWENCASFNPEDAKRLDIVEGRMIRINFEGRTASLPAHIQPGVAAGTVCAALGYGRTHAGPIAANYPTEKMFPLEKDILGGADVYPLTDVPGVTVTLLDTVSPLAKTQRYDRLTDPITGTRRPHVQETTLQDYFRDPTSGRPTLPAPGPGMWPKHTYAGHKWAMAIDLNACSGCSACVIACQSENNIPVVGKAEVRKSRDMHWMRIDRYYDGGENFNGDLRTAFQPMLCQQCDNAPCETVCPVLATVHSTEGLNMQVYNRCVGTRYCANNCPYKVRRFNWFDYAHEDLLQNMALNPAITVRTRGVMEKCTFCVQRIQETKAEARESGKKLQDGQVRPACMQSCPSDAIVFGDINDPNSRISKIAQEPRSYTVLGELGVAPSVFYQTKVRNKKV